MRFEKLFKYLEKNKYYVFSYEDLLIIDPDESKENIKKMLYRWRKARLIASIKKGLYELIYPKSFNVPDLYIANKLYTPSYISLETVLSNHSIIPEVGIAVTSITTKPTRRFKNNHGLFIYRTLDKNYFCGYYTETYNNFKINVAEPEKALMDFLYLKRFHKKPFDLKDERLDKDIILSLSKSKLKKYARLFGIKLEAIYANLWITTWACQIKRNAIN